MLLYVESTAFPCRTFVVRIQPFETVARVRAQLLHVLYEIRREHHQFRLRYKGQYMRDAYSVEDYGIIDGSIVKMVPLSKKVESAADLRSLVGSEVVDTTGNGIMPDVKDALKKEINIFDVRERLIFHFKGLLYLHFLCVLLSFLSTFWYSGIWTLLLWAFGAYFCPSFTRFSGFVGRQSIYKTEFCLIYGSFALCQMAVTVFFSVYVWAKVVHDGCKDWAFSGNCSYTLVYSGVFYAIQSLLLLMSAGLVWSLLWNIKVEYGDFIEKFLVQNRDIEEVMVAARSGRVKDRRVAAFELATMAASGDDNKFRIVAEGGLELLIRMGLSRDVATQEHAVEAIAELMTVPAIQDNFVEMGGVKTLTALLHTKDPKLLYQAATALSYITADTEENKYAVATDHGLDDLCQGARCRDIGCQRLIAGIFLDLAFNSDIRMQMASRNSPAQALVKLGKSTDPETQRFALQTLELLAIESSDMICAQTELLELLLQLPDLTVDTKVYILAGKILLYYAENDKACEEMMDQSRCKEALFQYARTKDPILQKVVAKVIYCMLEVKELKLRARHMELDEILRYIQDNAADREVWDMADHALQYMQSNDDLKSLPTMTAAEKLDRFTPDIKAKNGMNGSLTSLSSGSSIRKPPMAN